MNKILMIPAILVLLAQYVSASTFERVEYIDKKLPINQILFQHWQKNNIEQPPVVSDAHGQIAQRRRSAEFSQRQQQKQTLCMDRQIP